MAAFTMHFMFFKPVSSGGMFWNVCARINCFLLLAAALRMNQFFCIALCLTYILLTYIHSDSLHVACTLSWTDRRCEKVPIESVNMCVFSGFFVFQANFGPSFGHRISDLQEVPNPLFHCFLQWICNTSEVGVLKRTRGFRSAGMFVIVAIHIRSGCVSIELSNRSFW